MPSIDSAWLLYTVCRSLSSRPRMPRSVSAPLPGGGRGADLNPHELRYSFITLGLDAGANLRDMQRAAAQADPRTTADHDRRRKALDPSYLVERYLS